MKYKIGDIVIFNYGRQEGEIVSITNDEIYNIDWDDGSCGGITSVTEDEINKKIG
jgi:hypothetical protein